MEFVIYTNTVWDSPPRSRHQLAHALSENHKVTFVSSNLKGKPGLTINKVNDSFDLILPSFPVSRRVRYRMPLVNEAYQIWLFPKLKKHFEGREVILICSDFGAHLIGAYFKKFIYFASDDYINNVQVPALVKAYTRFTQNRLLKTASFTIATAKKLVDDFRKVNPKSYELPLGAPDFSKSKADEIRKRKPDGRLKVVLLGFIDKKKTPLDLMNAILRIENAELHLIGPIADDFLDFLEPAGKVVTHGVMTGDPLGRELEQMDVAIAPYYLEDPNSGRTPNKMWQYLASGLPAVITNLPNVRHWEFPSGTVYKANNDKAFVNQIVQAYQENTDSLVRERIAIASRNSWNSRANQLLGYIKDYFYDEK
ncbi:glycosyltransferase [Cyclobacterium jeungdonense]|uniref:Glycosyltransferase n=1 Tax=Cyclobacterium jeungdonense TaxID=708087 RepID=A0ABT8C1E8_9BACT|nr:glycosyltransferase [Cyclobacterium jeungdonense]MDN3686618.1 glycosyltransferase [Cyclobacterium jeungdonense]